MVVRGSRHELGQDMWGWDLLGMGVMIVLASLNEVCKKMIPRVTPKFKDQMEGAHDV